MPKFLICDNQANQLVYVCTPEHWFTDFLYLGFLEEENPAY